MKPRAKKMFRPHIKILMSIMITKPSFYSKNNSKVNFSFWEKIIFVVENFKIRVWGRVRGLGKKPGINYVFLHLTNSGEDSKLFHRQKRPKVDTLFSSFFRRVRATSMTQRRVENTRVHFWTNSPVSVKNSRQNHFFDLKLIKFADGAQFVMTIGP